MLISLFQIYHLNNWIDKNYFIFNINYVLSYTGVQAYIFYYNHEKTRQTRRLKIGRWTALKILIN